jgi:hypothetical protein
MSQYLQFLPTEFETAKLPGQHQQGGAHSASFAPSGKQTVRIVQQTKLA